MARRNSAEKILGIKAALAAGGMSHKEIGKKFDIHFSTVSKIKRGVVGRGVAAPAAISTAPQSPTGSDRRSAFAHHLPEILRLTAEKYTGYEIAKKLGITESCVYYYKKKGMKSTESQAEEGALTNGSNAINKNIAIGIAYAEVERFITNISQRLGISADVLRPRLSELLGRSPLR